MVRLQYADDKVLLFQPDLHNIATVKTLLICFEALSGMKINITKSEAFTIGQDADEGRTHIANLLKCRKRISPSPYANKIPTKSDRDPTVEKVIRRCDSWKGKPMSFVARLTHTNACLSAIHTFVMGLFILGEGVHMKFDKVPAHFF